MRIMNRLGKEILFFDGAMGTLLQHYGLQVGEVGEAYNFTRPKLIEDIHQQYLEAGADIIKTHTFGANHFRLQDTPYSVEEVVTKATEIAKDAVRKSGKEAYVALDVGSTGHWMSPLGETSKELLEETFRRQVVAGAKAGCDLILLETFVEINELILAAQVAKEQTKLPVVCTMSFEASGKTYFGTSIKEMAEQLERLNVDALGINCSVGPSGLVALAEEMLAITSLPVVIGPNAGMPIQKEGVFVYPIDPEQFAEQMKRFAQIGVSVLGGCCGTTPEYIKKMVTLIK